VAFICKGFEVKLSLAMVNVPVTSLEGATVCVKE